MLANSWESQIQQLPQTVFTPLTAAAEIEAIEGVAAAVELVEEGEEGAAGAHTAEWTTTPPLSAAGSIARFGAVTPLRSTTPNVRAIAGACPAISGPTASTGSALWNNEIKLGNQDWQPRQLQLLMVIATCFDWSTTPASLPSIQQQLPWRRGWPTRVHRTTCAATEAALRPSRHSVRQYISSLMTIQWWLLHTMA